MKPRTGSLLIVDDEELNRDMLSRRLEFEGYSVTAAENGRAALDLLQRQPFDMVLLDFMMPEMNGMQVLSHLRKTYTPADLPIIMVTARTQSEEMVEAFNLGANDYVTKPIDFPVALARIAIHLSNKWAQAALKESEQRYSLAARGANDGLWDWDFATGLIYYSPRWKAMLGFEDGEITSSPDEWFKRVHAEDAEQVQAALAAHRQGLTPQFESEFRMIHKDQTYRWMLSRGVTLHDKEGKELRMAGSQTDVTRGRAADALTGLPNRVLFLDRLGRALEKTRHRSDYLFAVLFLDLDRFKVINDSLGHLVGDQLLVAIARRLESCLRASDTVVRGSEDWTVARFGGDEFTILLDGIKHPDNANNVAERIQKTLSQPFSLQGHDVFSSVSIGITLGGMNYERPEDLLRDADTAMYRAKAQGKARSVVFDADMRSQALNRLTAETELRRALEREEFCLHYQPILSLTTERINGFEALVRWRHPERGLVMPSEFIPIAEETGLIVPLGSWVLKEACRQMNLWQQRYPQSPAQVISVNLSTRQLQEESLVTEVAEVLRTSHLEPGSLKLEITETAIMENPDHAAQVLQQIRALGVRIGLDDFGTGYSSLHYLHRFPIDTLKIDRSFINDMHTGREHEEIIQAIVTLAHNLQMDVVAEGVETKEQRSRLRELACEFGQGFFYSKPVDSNLAEALLVAERKKGELPV